MAIHSWLTPIPLDFDATGNVTASRPAKVLTITTEMLKEDVKERMDAIYSKLSYTGIVSGTLGMHIEDQYKIALDGLKGKNPLWIVTRKRVKDIQDIPIIVEEMQPDIVFLDGLYKLKVEGARFKSTWEKVTEIADELDLISKTKGVRIVATTQFNRGAVKASGAKKGKKIPMAGLENLAFADALGMNPDVILGVISSKDMKENNEAILQLIANRRGKEGAWLCNFNPDQGEFGEISVVDGGMDADSDDEGGGEADTSENY
jgi:replicative DNA helicase